MKTTTIRINTNTDHAHEDYGPPIPRSQELWNIWGCSLHQHCFVHQNPVSGVVTHEPPELFWIEHTSYCVGADKGCRYFIHWLVGELEEPGTYGDQAY